MITANEEESGSSNFRVPSRESRGSPGRMQSPAEEVKADKA